MPDQLLTLTEVSERLRVPPGTLRVWRAQGRGPKGFKVEGSLRFLESDVDAWLERQYNLTGRPNAA